MTPKARKGGEHVEKSRRNGKIHRGRKRSMRKRVVHGKEKERCEKGRKKTERAVHEEGKEQLTKDGGATRKDRIVHQPSCKGWTDVLEGKRR
jgi:hypothetical protein